MYAIRSYYEIRHLLRDLHRNFFLRLGRRGAEVRRRYDLIQCEERVVACRFLGEDVERGPGDMARLDGRLEVGLDDQSYNFV